MYVQLTIDPDMGERVAYNAPDFPVRTAEAVLSTFYQYTVGCHWHRDFEFVLPRQGDTTYFVNGAFAPVRQGQCIFVNANRLHYNFSPNRSECLYDVLLFPPAVLGELPLPMTRYALELGLDSQRDYLVFDPQDADGAEAVALVQDICQTCREPQPAHELYVQGACARLVALLWRVLRPVAQTAAANPAWVILRNMTGFVQANYADDIRLSDIATAGAVCASACCRLFRTHLHTTPIAYLNRYRLEKARELLRGTYYSITEIAQRCGFDGGSYFAESFRKAYGISPREARGARAKQTGRAQSAT